MCVFIYCGNKFLGNRKESLQAEADFIHLAQQIEEHEDYKEYTSQSYTIKSNENQQEPHHKYDALYEKNNDLVGWIKIDGTSIDYPVMQTPDNPNYYLRRNFEKNYSVSGTPYVAEICDIDTSDNLIIYGHNMRSGGMFHPLLNYTDREFFKNHPTLQFNTLKKENTYQIVYVFKASAENLSREKFPFGYTNFNSAEDFEDFKEDCEKVKLYNTDKSISFGDELVTLVTCEYSNRNGRFVIVAKMI